MPAPRPPLTGSTHPLPFEKLSPEDFERLCYALVAREGYTVPEHIGASGQDDGCDIIASKDGAPVVFQCKRYPRVSPAEAEAAIDKVLALSAVERPTHFVLVAAGTVSKEARKRLRARAGGLSTEVWDRTFLDDRVHRYPDLRARFFHLSEESRLPLKLYLNRRLASTDTPSEAALLSPYSFSVPLVGREAVLKDLWSWMKNGRPISVRVLTARAGTGKTRLALELCEQADRAGWEAGFLSEIPNRHTNWGWAGPTLAVVDYAASRARALHDWLVELADHPRKEGSPLRLLLLERHADSSGGWWREAFGVGGGDTEAVERLLDLAAGSVVLPPLIRPKERRSVLVSILERMGSAVQPPELAASPRFEEKLGEITWGGEPLFLLMAGLVAARAGFGEVLALAATDLGFRIAGHEVHRIHEIARARKIPEVLLSHLAAFVTLCQGLSQREVEGVVEEEAKALGCSAGEGPLAVYEALAAALPDDEDAVAPILPDVVGEAVILEALGGGSAEKATLAISRASRQAGERVTASLIHLAQDYGEDRPNPLLWLQRLAEEKSLDLKGLDALLRQTPASTLVMREFAADLAARAVELARRGPDRETLADLLDHLSVRLSNLGRLEDTLAAAEEATRIYRQLAATRPDAFWHKLAEALCDLSISLRDLGLRKDALAAAEEAAQLYRAAVARNDTSRSDLARALNNLSCRLIGLERQEDALVAIEEAVAIQRQLAAERPEDYQHDLATALSNLSFDLSRLGRREDALIVIEEAVAIRRELAAASPDVLRFRRHLADNLEDLYILLGDLGRHDDALAVGNEAIAIRRQLAVTLPDAFRPALASALQKLSVRLSKLGRPQDALAATEEASQLYRQLAAAHPHAFPFRPNLANALNTLSNALADLGRLEDAVAASEEAVEIWRELASGRPDAFCFDLAGTLYNLTNRLEELGWYEAALGASEEALRTLAPYFFADPAALSKWIDLLVFNYFDCAEKTGTSPDRDLVDPLVDLLERVAPW